MEMSYCLPGWWTAFGVSFLAAEAAHLITARGARLERMDLDKREMSAAYVHVAPGLGGGAACGRAVHSALWVPILSHLGLAVALCGAVALTVFPKYWSPQTDAGLYHLLNAPFYVGLATSYVCDLVLLWQYYAARRLGACVGTI